LTSARLEAFLAELNTNDIIKGMYRRHGLWFGWAAMATITLANVATLMASTIINVAIPDIMGTFGIGQDKAQWLATAFLASSTVTMLMNSWLIQTLGARYTVIMAMVLFMSGSLLGGVSPNMDLLTVARIMQGAATGVITPLGMSMVFQLFPAGRQGRVMGVTAIGLVLAPALGPALGGYLIDALNWRYTYLMGIPFSLIVVPMAALFMPPRDPNLPRHRLDWQGLLLITIAISSLLIALSNGQREGWNSNFVLSWFAVAIAGSVSFVYWETHTPQPLLDLRVFGFYKFAVISVLAFIFGAGLYGSTYLVPLFLQIAQNLTATDSGLMMLPAALVMGLLFPISGRLSDRIDQRLLLGTGFLIMAVSTLLMSGADINTSWWTFAWWLIISRIGIGIMAPCLNLSAIQGLPLEYLQQGAGVMNFVRQLGGAFGVNLLSVALGHRVTFHRDALMATQSWGHSDTFEMMAELQRELVVAGLTFWEQQYVAYSAIGRIVQRQAYVYGFQDSFLLLTALFLGTMIPLSMLRRRHMRTPR
jgi:EmrB/QacA subfamily drug resistance transporter